MSCEVVRSLTTSSTWLCRKRQRSVRVYAPVKLRFSFNYLFREFIDSLMVILYSAFIPSLVTSKLHLISIAESPVPKSPEKPAPQNSLWISKSSANLRGSELFELRVLSSQSLCDEEFRTSFLTSHAPMHYRILEVNFLNER